ncbi:hypothetical protein [Caldithrix abyssi]
MMKIFILIIAFTKITSIIPGASNNSSDTMVGPFVTCAYQYKGYDTPRVAIVKDWVSFVYQYSTHITGEWYLKKFGNPQNIGPQVGSRNLVEGIDGKRVWTEWHPQFHDNNLQLKGKIADGCYKGERL